MMHWDRSRSDTGTCRGSRGCPGGGEGGTQIPQKVREASVVDYIYIYIYIEGRGGGGRVQLSSNLVRYPFPQYSL